MSNLRHVIIDGFNVIFGDEQLRKRFDRSQENAREELVKIAQILHDDVGYQVTVVFDGQGERLNIEHPFRSDSFTVIHSTSQLSADGVIERMLSRSKQIHRLVVVSNDQMIRNAAIGCGAEFQGVEAFLDWTRGVARKRMAHVRNHVKGPHQGGIENRLPL